jgi:hypothetical protein
VSKSPQLRPKLQSIIAFRNKRQKNSLPERGFPLSSHSFRISAELWFDHVV